MLPNLKHIRRCKSANEVRKALKLKSPEKYKIHKLLSEEDVKSRQATLEFKTRAERDEWIKWYAKDGANHFFSWMITPCNRDNPTECDRKWRAYAEEKLKNWPHDNERFV